MDALTGSAHLALAGFGFRWWQQFGITGKVLKVESAIFVQLI
jgi:hypothetical protein